MTGPELPETIAAELGLDNIHVLIARIRATGGRAGRLTRRRRAIVGSTHRFSVTLLVALWNNHHHLKKPRRSPNTEILEQGQSRLTNYNETPYASSSLTIARHKHPSRHHMGKPISPATCPSAENFQRAGHWARAHPQRAREFLMSAPEDDTPHRARAYLLTDNMVSVTASQHAEMRPSLNEVSQRAVEATARPTPSVFLAVSPTATTAPSNPATTITLTVRPWASCALR